MIFAKRLNSITSIVLCAFLFVLSTSPLAENVRIPVGSQAEGEWTGDIPSKGMSKEQVQEKFGAPQSTDGPRGNPPIYFWEYEDFTVYFESDYVLHAVIKRQ